MTGERIKRGTAPAKGGAASRPKGRPKPRQATWVDRAVAMLPFSGETLSRLLTGLVVLLSAGVLWMVAMFFGLPGIAGQEFAAFAARSGFRVAKVEVKGVKRMDETRVYSEALREVDRSMVSVDLVALRGQIRRIGWVEDARVTRRLPGTLVIDIVERVPVAVWQHEAKLSLIDVNGVVLEPVDARAMPDLPLVVGPAANRETRSLQSLMEAAPALKPLLAGATWVGNRRWDLRFQSGETLALPEGIAPAQAALMKFAQLEGVNRLLGRGIVRFDMRDPARFVLRMPSEAKPRAIDPAKAANGDLKGDGQADSSPQAEASPAAARLAAAGDL